LANQITPEIHQALMRALRSSTKFLGIIPRAKADRSRNGQDKGTLGLVHESGGAEGICPDSPSSQQEMFMRTVERLARSISDDDCAICGKTKSQHHTNSGYGMCQIYPVFVSKRNIFERLADEALSKAHHTGG
jgi:hypothetical protein